MNPTYQKQRHLPLYLLCYATLISLNVAFAQDSTQAHSHQAVGTQVSSFMKQLVDQGEVSGGVTLFAKDGRIRHLAANGYSDRENRIPMKTDSIFRVASMSKTITAVAVLRLVETGRLSLDDPLHNFIPSFKNARVLISVEPLRTKPVERAITIRHLLNSTSGMGYPFSEKTGSYFRKLKIPAGCLTSELTLEELADRVAKVPLAFEPGTDWEYSISLDVLGRVVEVITKKSFPEYCRKEVFEPLGMVDTHFHIPDDKRDRLVAAYVPNGNEGIRKLADGEQFDDGNDIISADYPYAARHNCYSGGGGLCSTAQDYFRFCQMLLNEGKIDDVRFLSSKLVSEMTSNQIGDKKCPFISPKWGFGVGVTPRTDHEVHPNLRGSFIWAGSWSGHFRVSKPGNWILITMSQKNWTDDTTPLWIKKFDQIAAGAVHKDR